MHKQVLLIEDDQEIGELLSEYLAQHQFKVLHKDTANKGLDVLIEQSDTISAIILDVMLPDGNGFEVCKQIRQSHTEMNNIPIIMLTAKGDAMDRIIGLEIGADDYMAKPFEPRELVARLNAVLRRFDVANDKLPTDKQHKDSLEFGSLLINTSNRTVYLQDKLCELTGYQFDIIYALASRAGRVTSREQLMNLLKDQNYDIFDRSIDVHISRIRAEIEIDSKHPKRIITKRGIGYIFSAEQE